MSHNSFTKNGKTLKALSPKKVVSRVATIFGEEKVKTIEHIVPKKRKIELLVDKYILVGEYFQKKLPKIFDHQIAPKTVFRWAGASVAAFLIVAIPTIAIPNKITTKINNKYSIYSSKPLTLEASNQEVAAKDSRAVKINAVFKEYNCPLEGMGETFVREADKNNIPWWLVASVAFQESSCGKNTPKVDGEESYNAWGWGVYGNTTTHFDNWARGVERVSQYFGDKFYSNDVDDLCEIMKTYTPPSNGSWCKGVEYFGDIIRNYKSPIEL